MKNDPALFSCAHFRAEMIVRNDTRCALLFSLLKTQNCKGEQKNITENISLEFCKYDILKFMPIKGSVVCFVEEHSAATCYQIFTI